jgi:uncharacterized membrane protein HdeD (DUF308 family)
MSDTDAASPAPASAPVLGELVHNWGWLLAQGILLVILGTIGLGLTFWLTLATIFIFGILLLIGGVVQLFQAAKCRGWQSVLWHLLIALLYVLAGLSIMADPLVASTLITLLLAGALIGIGVLRLVMAFQFKGAGNWFWPLIGGLAAIVLGILIVTHWPVSGFWVIGLFVAIEMIFSGWSYIIIAIGARQLGKQSASAP